MTQWYTGPLVKNVKFHFKVRKDIDLLKKIKGIEEFCSVKWHVNFAVVRDVCAIFIIYYSSNFINVTGVKRIRSISSVISTFCSLFGIDTTAILSPYVIDNITASGSFNRIIDLSKLKERLNSSSIFTCGYNSIYFPGAFCKTTNLGLVTVFRTGSYVILGGKCTKNVNKVLKHMLAVINTL